MRTVDWTIPAYHCPDCLRRIKHILDEIEDVRLIRSDQAQHRLSLEAQTVEALAYAKRRLAAAGYPVQPNHSRDNTLSAE